MKLSTLPVRLNTSLRRFWRLGRVLLHIVTGVILSLLTPRTGNAPRLWPLRWWSRRLLRILNVQLEISGNYAPGPALLVANHISWLDVMCLAAACPTYFLAKGEVARWPLFGWLCHRSGTLFIERGERHSSSMACEQIVWRLRAGHKVLIFPEGTSTDGQSVRRFHARLLQAAELAKTPLQPIAIAYPTSTGPNRIVPFIGDADLGTHLWRLLAAPKTEARLQFCPPRVPAQETRNALARHCQNAIEQALPILHGNVPTATAQGVPRTNFYHSAQ